MSDLDVSSIPVTGVAGAALVVFYKLVMWFGNLWATVNRERMAKDHEAAELDRANANRIADRQSTDMNHLAGVVNDHTARDLASIGKLSDAVGALKETVFSLSSKIDTIAWVQERTPVPDDPTGRPSLASERRRKMRAP